MLALQLAMLSVRHSQVAAPNVPPCTARQAAAPSKPVCQHCALPALPCGLTAVLPLHLSHLQAVCHSAGCAGQGTGCSAAAAERVPLQPHDWQLPGCHCQPPLTAFGSAGPEAVAAGGHAVVQGQRRAAQGHAGACLYRCYVLLAETHVEKLLLVSRGTGRCGVEGRGTTQHNTAQHNTLVADRH